VLIFVQSIERAKELYKELVLTDIRVDVIHSHLPEAQVMSWSLWSSLPLSLAPKP